MNGKALNLFWGVGTLILGGLIMSTVEGRSTIIPEAFNTSNGIEVWVTQRHSLPFVVLKVVVKAGSVYDPEEKAGLAYLVSQLIPEGTKKMSGKEVFKTLDYMGVALSTSCTKEYASLTLVTLKEHLKKSLGIMSELLIHPAFRNEDFQRVKTELIGELLKEEEDPGIVASKAFDEVLFSSHPYHRPEKGYISTVEKIAREDAVNFHKKFYHPNHTILAVAGDISLEEARDTLEEYLGDWKPAKDSLPLIPDPRPMKEPKEMVIEKEVTQANIIIGHIGMKRSDPDFLKVYVMNQILGGGGLTSRLFKKIREEKGYSYSVYSYFPPSFWVGAFRIVLQTKNENIEKVMREVKFELERFIKEGPTEEEVEDAKRYLTGSFPLRLDTNLEIADYMAFAAFHGLGRDYFYRFPREIKEVTREEVVEVAKRYLHPQHLLTVVVRNPSLP